MIMRHVLVLLVIGLEGMSKILVVLYNIEAVSYWNSVFAVQLWHLFLNYLFQYLAFINTPIYRDGKSTIKMT